MAFSDKKEKESRRQSLLTMTLQDINNELDNAERMLGFEAASASTRVQNNVAHIMRWVKMSSDEFRAEMNRCRAEKKDINIVSGAYTPDGGQRIPLTDGGEYMFPVLADIIELQKERLSRITFAQEQMSREFDEMAMRSEINTELSTAI